MLSCRKSTNRRSHHRCRRLVALILAAAMHTIAARPNAPARAIRGATATRLETYRAISASSATRRATLARLLPGGGGLDFAAVGHATLVVSLGLLQRDRWLRLTGHTPQRRAGKRTHTTRLVRVGLGEAAGEHKKQASEDLGCGRHGKHRAGGAARERKEGS